MSDSRPDGSGENGRGDGVGDPDDGDGTPVSRRELLALAGLGVTGTANCVSNGRDGVDPTTAARDGASRATTDGGVAPERTTGADDARLFQQVVGSEPWMYDTIQAAHDDLPGVGGLVYVTPSYDSSAERFPITLTNVVTVEGASRGGTVVRGTDDSEPVFRIKEVDFSYVHARTIKNVSVEGGSTGIDVDPETHAVVQNVSVSETASHGVTVSADNDLPQGSFLNVFRNVDVSSCGGSGFSFEGSISHASTLDRCSALRNAEHGADVHGVATYVKGGAYQYNGGHGIRLSRGMNQSVRDVYVEKNGNPERAAADDPFGAGVRVDGSQVVVANCYFQGLGEQNRGVDVRAGHGVDVRNCFFRNHADGSVFVGTGSTDCDLHLPSNATEDATFLVADEGERTRSNGTLLPTDLSTVGGRHFHDTGYDDGTNTESGEPELAVWNGETWHTWGGDSIDPETAPGSEYDPL